MTYLLDTNLVSALRQRRTSNVAAQQWARRQPLRALHISVVTVFELEGGTRRLERRDPTQGLTLRRWLEASVVSAFDSRIIPIDVHVARRAAALHDPDPKPERDAYIAATALVHDLTVVTRNVRDFESTGVRLINPWED